MNPDRPQQSACLPPLEGYKRRPTSVGGGESFDTTELINGLMKHGVSCTERGNLNILQWERKRNATQVRNTSELEQWRVRNTDIERMDGHDKPNKVVQARNERAHDVTAAAP